MSVLLFELLTNCESFHRNREKKSFFEKLKIRFHKEGSTGKIESVTPSLLVRPSLHLSTDAPFFKTKL